MLERVLWIAPLCAIAVGLLMVAARYVERRRASPGQYRRASLAWAVVDGIEATIFFVFGLSGTVLGLAEGGTIGLIPGVALGLIAGVAVSRTVKPSVAPLVMRCFGA